MMPSLGAKSTSAMLALAAGLLMPVPLSALVGVPVAAAENIVTLKGDPAAEAAEREHLFADLAGAANAGEARGITSKIWALWFRAPDPAAAALMERAIDLRIARDYAGAIAVLDTLVANSPEWAEAWNQRATMRYVVGDYAGSLADIDRVIALEPKHFGALSGQAIILMHQGRMEEGQHALRRAVEIDPFLSERALLMEPPGQDI